MRTRICVVEHDRDTRELIVELLSDHGHVVHAYRNAGEALENWYDIERDPPCFFYVDVTSDDAVVRLVEQLRQQLPAVPLVAVSALPPDMEPHAFVSRRVQRVLLKPFSLRELERHIQRVCERSA